MEDLSEEFLKANCPHCNANSQAFSYILEKTESFYIVCDAHPLVEGHILIIPKKHVSCVGAYTSDLFDEFVKLNKKVSDFLTNEYGSVSSFEHGIFGQTVFHSHIHYIPYSGKPDEIVPEKEKISEINNLAELKTLFKVSGGYLYFSINKNKWTVDVSISAPRFFRDRFSKSLGKPERGNWKTMALNKKLMQETNRENENTLKKWNKNFN